MSMQKINQPSITWSRSDYKPKLREPIGLGISMVPPPAVLRSSLFLLSYHVTANRKQRTTNTGSRITMDWMSQLHSELSQAEQENEHLVRENESLEKLLASNKAEFSISQKKYDTQVANYQTKIAALLRDQEAHKNSMEDKISGLESLNNDYNIKLRAVKRRIKL